jgi:hypothetical protein
MTRSAGNQRCSQVLRWSNPSMTTAANILTLPRRKIRHPRNVRILPPSRDFH